MVKKMVYVEIGWVFVITTLYNVMLNSMDSTVDISYPCWIGNVFLFMFNIIIWASIIRISQNSHTSDYKYLMVFLFSIPFGTTNHAQTLIPRQNCPTINMI